MDTTAEILACPLSIKKQYFGILPELLKFPNYYQRDNRKQIFERHLNNEFTEDARTFFIEKIKERERIHFEFMNTVFPECYKIRFGKELKEDFPEMPEHDHTKDEYFAFILALHFEMLKNPETEEDKKAKPQVEVLVKHELDRHYIYEPHHPEWEKLHKKEISYIDIFEMAIDRLSRNVQFARGEINLAKMHQFFPKFYEGSEADIEVKKTLYWNAVLLFQEYVSKRSKEMYWNAVLEKN